jgi:hypothetical protein
MELALANGQTELVGGAVVPELGGSPATELWAVMYDIDDNNQIDFGDFSFFAAAFGKMVEPPVPNRRMSGGRTSTNQAGSISATWPSSRPISARPARPCKRANRRWSSRPTSRTPGELVPLTLTC